MKTLEFKSINDLTMEELNDLAKATTVIGMMKIWVQDVKNGNDLKLWVIRVYESHQLIAWASLTNEELFTTIGVYVKREYRRTGLGRDLTLQTIDFFNSDQIPWPKPLICKPWDYKSRLFFEVVGIPKQQSS